MQLAITTHTANAISRKRVYRRHNHLEKLTAIGFIGLQTCVALGCLRSRRAQRLGCGVCPWRLDCRGRRRDRDLARLRLTAGGRRRSLHISGGRWWGGGDAEWRRHCNIDHALS